MHAPPPAAEVAPRLMVVFCAHREQLDGEWRGTERRGVREHAVPELDAGGREVTEGVVVAQCRGEAHDTRRHFAAGVGRGLRERATEPTAREHADAEGAGTLRIKARPSAYSPAEPVVRGVEEGDRGVAAGAFGRDQVRHRARPVRRRRRRGPRAGRRGDGGGRAREASAAG